MEKFTFTLPSKSPGVYAFKHEPTGKTYVGSASSLHRRFQEWRSVINSGSYWKSGVLAEALKDTQPRDWSFYVVVETSTPAEALAKENQVIATISDAFPDLCLNTRLANFQVKGQAAVALTKLTLAGEEVTHPAAAEYLECKPKTLAKRLAKYRAKGIYELTVEELSVVPSGRPRNEL